MKTAMMFGMALAMMVTMGTAAKADDCWDNYNKYMDKYYEHLAEAAEEAAEGDWGEYREEMRQAKEDYRTAQQYKPASPKVVVVPSKQQPSSRPKMIVVPSKPNRNRRRNRPTVIIRLPR
ncbi:MAG: hypothetical protein GXP25_04120 [Planctomycetes bacterium]|nr:hypothetical protein [Planctomycetota bacterium]